MMNRWHLTTDHMQLLPGPAMKPTYNGFIPKRSILYDKHAPVQKTKICTFHNFRPSNRIGRNQAHKA